MALIDASMLEDIFESTMPTSRDPNGRFLLDVDGTTLVISAGVLSVGVVDTVNIAAGAVGPTKIGFTSADVPHVSPSILSTNVSDALEETAQGYISRLPLAGGTLSGDVDMGGNSITGLAPATLSSDAMSLESSRLLVREGYFNRAPVGYAGPTVPHGALKAGWIRATGSVYLTVLPLVGDTLSINGVTLTFAAMGGPNLIQIGVSAAVTVVNAVSEINANTTNTLDGTPLNTNVYAVGDSGDGTALHLVVLNEDPPNTVEDGNDKPLSAVSAAIVIRPFEGGLGSVNSVEDGMIVPDLFANTLWMYDLMQPLLPWVELAGGGGGSVNASNVWYTGPAIPNVNPSVPDHLQNILISLNTVLGAGVTPSLHAASHQNSGLDELNVAGLSGVLADAQDAGSLQGNAVSAAAPAPSQVLAWNGAAWAPAAVGGSDYATLLGLVDGVGMSLGHVVVVASSNTASYAKADAGVTMPCRGMVSGTGVGVVNVRTHGYVSGLVGLTAGASYFVSSTTPGGITTTAPSSSGDWVQEIGWALTATIFVVDIKGAVEIL